MKKHKHLTLLLCMLLLGAILLSSCSVKNPADTETETADPSETDDTLAEKEAEARWIKYQEEYAKELMYQVDYDHHVEQIKAGKLNYFERVKSLTEMMNIILHTGEDSVNWDTFGYSDIYYGFNNVTSEHWLDEGRKEYIAVLWSPSNTLLSVNYRCYIQVPFAEPLDESDGKILAEPDGNREGEPELLTELRDIIAKSKSFDEIRTALTEQQFDQKKTEENRYDKKVDGITITVYLAEKANYVWCTTNITSLLGSAVKQ